MTTTARTRTVLYVPASRASAVERARELEVDVVILDLEDAVGPEDKAAARQAAVAAVSQRGFRAPLVGVRPNGADTPWGADDLSALSEALPDLVVVPKVETPMGLAGVLHVLPKALVWAMIETPPALCRLPAIAAAVADRTGSALMFGANDMIAAVGCEPGADRAPLHWAMSAVVFTARAYGLLAIDSVFNRLDDDAGLEAECAQGRRWGFDGKGLIHPRQIEIATRAFAPPPDQIAEAQTIVAAYDTPGAEAAGAIRIDGRMVERLHLDRARRLLALHAKTESA